LTTSAAISEDPVNPTSVGEPVSTYAAPECQDFPIRPVVEAAVDSSVTGRRSGDEGNCPARENDAEQKELSNDTAIYATATQVKLLFSDESSRAPFAFDENIRQCKRLMGKQNFDSYAYVVY
jgi:hypothetical protein